VDVADLLWVRSRGGLTCDLLAKNAKNCFE
jgi:hypothetical protein